MASISDLLQESLDIIGSELDREDGISSPSNTISASAKLLQKKQEEENMLSSLDFIPLKMPEKKVDDPFANGRAPLMNQISQTSVEPPKYWKSKNEINKNQAYSSTSNKKNKNKQRGEDYNDKLSGKMAQKLSKQKLRNKLKHT